MISITIHLEGEGCWPDIANEGCIHLDSDGKPIQVALLKGGMESGLPSVAIRFDLPDGRIVVGETSARLFCIAAKAVMARHPNLFD